MSKGERTRKEILDRAFVLAGEIGLEALSLGTLAAETGLSKSGLFAHFKSKEALQLDLLKEAVERFTETVVRPALKAPPGEPRVRALFERYQRWKSGEGAGSVLKQATGCIFMSLSHEYDDRPGPVRERLVEALCDWHDTICRVAATAKKQGDFRADLDTDLFAFEFMGIAMSHHHAERLLELDAAERLNAAAFESLIARSRAPA